MNTRYRSVETAKAAVDAYVVQLTVHQVLQEFMFVQGPRFVLPAYDVSAPRSMFNRCFSGIQPVGGGHWRGFHSLIRSGPLSLPLYPPLFSRYQGTVQTGKQQASRVSVFEKLESLQDRGRRVDHPDVRRIIPGLLPFTRCSVVLTNR